MKRKTAYKKVLLILLVLGLTTCASACNKDEKVNIENVENAVKGVEENMIMENFSCETNQGTTYELYNRKDKKPVFINFWATWCPPCVREMPDLQEIYNEYKERVDFIFINNGDSEEIVDEFIKENGYTMPVGYDRNNELTYKYQITAIPMTFILDEKNNIKETLIGARSGLEYKKYIDNVLGNK